MRTYLFLTLLGSALFHSQVGINTTDPKTTLDVTAKDEAFPGMQAPRLSRAELSSKTSYGTAQTGAIIYINDISAGDTTGQRASITSTGYYYFDGAAWQKMFSQPENIYSTNGTLNGNRTVSQNVNTLAFTSTAVNGFSVDGTTLSVDAANNRIGLGTDAPTQSLDVNGRARIRNTDQLTSTSLSPVYVDENGLIGKASASSQSQVALYESTSTLAFTTSDYNAGNEQVVPITAGHQSINTINTTVPATGNVRIDQAGNYLIGVSLNFMLGSAATDARIFMAINIDISTDAGVSWTTISGARPVFFLYWSPGMNQPYTLPFVIKNFNAGDLVRIKFYRTLAGTTLQGDEVNQISLTEGYGASSFTLALSKM